MVCSSEIILFHGACYLLSWLIGLFWHQLSVHCPRLTGRCLFAGSGAKRLLDACLYIIFVCAVDLYCSISATIRHLFGACWLVNMRCAIWGSSHNLQKGVPSLQIKLCKLEILQQVVIMNRRYEYT